MPRGTPASIIDSIKDIFMEKLTIGALITALLSAITGGIEKQAWVGTVEGFGLFLFIVVVNLIITSFDYIKDSRFLKLQEFLKRERISVIRGKAFQTRSISVWKLVVGDVIMLETGSRVPADCLVIESTNLEVSGYDDVEQAKRDKESNPFLTAGSLISQGNGKALVCAVGANSTRPIQEKKMDMNKDSPLNQKLDNVAGQLMLFALITAAVILVELLIFLFINIAQAENKWLTFLGGLPRRFNQAVVLAIVSFPEGLALTFQLSMAFVVMQMYRRDNVLVRDLNAPEFMGQAEEIIVGKTGTITKGEMSVKRIYLADGSAITNSRKNTLLNINLEKETLERIKEAILFNSQARIETDETFYVPVGNPTDVCMINFLQDADIPVHLVVQRKYAGNRFLHERGFGKDERTYVTSVINYEDDQSVDIFIKGAPEDVLAKCAGDDYDPTDMLGLIGREASEHGYRMIAFAHYRMERGEYEGHIEEGKTFGEIAAEQTFTPLSVFGLKDGLRPEVRSAIEYSRDSAELNVRLVSNDLRETVIKVAEMAHILDEGEYNMENVVMSGDDFYTAIGGIDIERNIAGHTIKTLTNMGAFEDIIKSLKVLYRANADHKEALVIGLKSLRILKLEDKIAELDNEKKQLNMIENEATKVIVTGEGANDAEALNEAQIGVAMKTSVAAAQAASQLVLTDNNFKSCLQAILWGRNIYQNVTRFLQFQMTVNLSCILVVFIGVFFYSELPMSSAQLLWINLIMDILAAIALGTEPPMPSLVKGSPRSQTALLKQKQVWRQIIGVSAYNVLVCLLLFIFGPNMVAIDEGISWNGYAKLDLKMPSDKNACKPYPQVLIPGMEANAECKAYRQSAAKGTLLTYVFNTFVFLQIFNLWNCRKIGITDKNILERPFHNFYFLIIFFGMIATQIMLVQYAGWLLHATPLETRSEWGAAMTVGISVWLVAFILKLTPEAWVNKIPDVLDEDEKKKHPIVAKSAELLGKPSEADGEATEEGENEEDAAEGEQTDGGEPNDAEAGIGNGISTTNDGGYERM